MLETVLILCLINIVLSIFLVVHAVFSTEEIMFDCPFNSKISCNSKANCMNCFVAKHYIIYNLERESKQND